MLSAPPLSTFPPQDCGGCTVFAQTSPLARAPRPLTRLGLCAYCSDLFFAPVTQQVSNNMKTAAVSRAKAYLKVRQKAVRDGMKELGLDGLLLTHPPDLAYLTNFTGDDSIGIVT